MGKILAFAGRWPPDLILGSHIERMISAKGRERVRFIHNETGFAFLGLDVSASPGS